MGERGPALLQYITLREVSGRYFGPVYDIINDVIVGFVTVTHDMI